MPWYLLPLVVLAAVAVGVSVRLRRTGAKEAIVGQLLGGLNVFVAAMLAVVTIALFQFGDVYFVHASAVFGLAVCVAWVIWGLVPVRSGVAGAWKAVVGHLLVLLGTLLFGSVTYFIPILEWLDLLPSGSGAVLPWLGVITFPIALFLWPVGIALVWLPRSNTSLERRREG